MIIIDWSWCVERRLILLIALCYFILYFDKEWGGNEHVLDDNMNLHFDVFSLWQLFVILE